MNIQYNDRVVVYTEGGPKKGTVCVVGDEGIGVDLDSGELTTWFQPTYIRKLRTKAKTSYCVAGRHDKSLTEITFDSFDTLHEAEAYAKGRRIFLVTHRLIKGGL